MRDAPATAQRGGMSHFLLLYTLAADYLDRRPAHRDEHLSLAWAAASRGDLILGGALEPADAALLLFSSGEAAAAFAGVDPYVANGLVIRWEVRRWTTVVGAQAANPVHPA